VSFDVEPQSVKTAVDIRLAQVRHRRGVSASALARLVGVRRQTIYAIEAGAYVPNTEVALKLARELDVSIHSLFVLGTKPAPARRTLRPRRIPQSRAGADSRARRRKP
jgi:DNA-binding XRE family transcriptional regulator